MACAPVPTSAFITPAADLSSLPRKDMPQVDAAHPKYNHFLNTLGANVTCETVNVADLRARQAYVNAIHVGNHAEKTYDESSCTNNSPKVVKIKDNKFLLVDGDHHAAAQVTQGKKRIAVRVFSDVTFADFKKAADETFNWSDTLCGN